MKDLKNGDEVWILENNEVVYKAEVEKNELNTIPTDREFGNGYIIIKGFVGNEYLGSVVNVFKYRMDETTATAIDFPDTFVKIDYILYANKEELINAMKQHIKIYEEKIEHLTGELNKLTLDA